MSRIHEALRKAEQEQAAAQTRDISLVAIDSCRVPPVSAEPSGTKEADEGSEIEYASSVGFKAGNYLRFDDLKRKCVHPTWQPDVNTNVFFDFNADTKGAEQFRTLRSRLQQIRTSCNRPLRTVLVTSAVAGEGKTYVANNLAHAIARQQDGRVLLIDADLRSPRLHLALGAPIGPGLSDYLSDSRIEDLSIIQHGHEGNLCFIAAGNEAKDASELLSNRRFKALLDRVGPLFDWVILDSPPCLPVADAGTLVNLCDGVILVLRSGSTPSEAAQRACQEFRERNLVGVVLNRAEQAFQYPGTYDYNHTRTNNGNPR